MKKIFLLVLLLFLLFLVFIFDDMFVSYKETKNEYLYNQKELNSFVQIISLQKVYKDLLHLTIDLTDSVDQIYINGCLVKKVTEDGCSVDIKQLYTTLSNKLKASSFKRIILEEGYIVFYLDIDGVFSVQHYEFYYNRSGLINEFILSCFQERVIDGSWYYKYENGKECDG